MKRFVARNDADFAESAHLEPGPITWLPDDRVRRSRAALLGVGFVLGFGSVFLFAGLALMATDSALRIEVVRR